MVTKKIAAFYSLRKSKKLLRQLLRHYKRKQKFLDSSSQERIQSHISGLRTAILQKDPLIADRIAHQLEEMSLKLMPRSTWDKIRDSVVGLVSALLIAVVVRTMWFEPYTIPSGSMRPTLKETDFLVVSKTDYGLNVPLQPAHFYFDPALVQRGSIIVFNGANMDIPDNDTTYFYLFPGKKQFVKRLIGKPGDYLYFYGGQIYGISGNGKDLTMLRNPSWFQNLEHIPYIRPDTKVENYKNALVYYQMNIPVAKLTVSQLGLVQGEMIAQRNRPTPSNFFDLWGFKNYAMARLLTPEQMDKIHPGARKDLEDAPLYLELNHHHSITGTTLVRDGSNHTRPELSSSNSFIPLQQNHLDEIGKHLTTCRFSVKNGLAWRLGWDAQDFSGYLPRLSDVPDGTYEMQDGKAYKVLFGGITSELSKDHPLYRKTPERIQLLYNLGVEFLTHYNPVSATQYARPSRYAYFRNKDLYLLGAPVIRKNDPTLVLFQNREYQKQSMSTSVRPYHPFDDNGPPLTADGQIDADFIRKHGIQVPEKMYLVLGDNHAMSGDSRQFGFVPEDNLKGGVSFLFWPPGSRLGKPPQPSCPHFTLPNMTVWIVFISTMAAMSIYYRRKLANPLKF